jgi:hypothetical protein
LTFPLLDCSEFGNFVITLIHQYNLNVVLVPFGIAGYTQYTYVVVENQMYLQNKPKKLFIARLV